MILSAGSLALAIGGALAAAAAVTTYGVRGKTSSLLAPSVHRGPRDANTIALTFDDGPSEATLELLEVLRRHGVGATFFLCGANVRRLPQVARAIAEAGHEIGNHADTHTPFHLRSRSFIREEMERAQRSIAEATGASPRYFRAPYGVRWFGLGAEQRRLGLTGVMWTVIAYDWALPGRAVASRLLRGAANGAIFCLHDGRDTEVAPDISPTLEAVERIIPELASRGYRFVTMSEMLCPMN